MLKIKLSILILLLLFTRFYNLEETGIFFWDQSRDLVNIHQYFLEKKLTLVGPISEERLRVFSSLTYYMLMPFAVLGDFDPISTTYGAAFWGVFGALLIVLLTKKINAKLITLVSILMIVWFPLVEVSRSAWNPYLIPFWITLGLIFYQYKNKYSQTLAGMALGLGIHHHYLSIFATGLFILINIVLDFKRRKNYFSLFMIFGFFLAILPFIIFDLRHPPGLFITRSLYFNHINSSFVLNEFLNQTLTNFRATLFYYTHSGIISIIIAFLGILLFYFDFKNKRFAFIYSLPFLFQIIAIYFVADPFTHYFLPGLVFFLAWVIFPRPAMGGLISKLILTVLIIGSLITISTQLTVPAWSPSIKSIREINNFLNQAITKGDLKNVNIAVLASVDNQTYGGRYRDLLLVDNIRILSKYEYFISDHLFVVSQSSEEVVRLDHAAEMHKFRKGELKEKGNTSDGKWNIYLFGRNIDN